jgi:hypothetical protein
MSKLDLKNIFLVNITSLFSKLGSTGGTIVSISALITLGFVAGTNYTNNQRNIELIDMKKQNSIEINTLNTKIMYYEFENERLKSKNEILTNSVNQSLKKTESEKK